MFSLIIILKGERSKLYVTKLFIEVYCLATIIYLSIYLSIYLLLFKVVQRIATTEDRHDRRETLCLVKFFFNKKCEVKNWNIHTSISIHFQYSFKNHFALVRKVGRRSLNIPQIRKGEFLSMTLKASYKLQMFTQHCKLDRGEVEMYATSPV